MLIHRRQLDCQLYIVANISLLNIIGTKRTKRETSTTTKETTGTNGVRNQDAPVTAAQVVQSEEIRRKHWSSTLLELRYPGVSPVIGNRQANCVGSKRILMLLYVYFISRLLIGDIPGAVTSHLCWVTECCSVNITRGSCT